MRKLSIAFFVGLFATLNAHAICYPTAASWNSVASVGYGINALSITGYSGSTLTDAGMTAATSTTTGYLDRTSMAPVNFLQGGVYSATGTWGTASGYQELQMWIDFNDDGVFAATEEVTPVSGFSTSAPPPTVFNITIPVGAATGIHTMRLRGIWEQISTTLGTAPAHLDPCLIQYLTTNPKYWSGNVVDYRANIISPCPFTASASNSGPFCPGAPVSLVGATTAPTYSWTGPGGFSSASLSPTAPGITTAGTYTFTASNGTCTTTLTTNVTLLAAAPVPTVTPATAAICNGGSLSLVATVPPTPGTILSQDFNTSIAPWTVDNTGATVTAALMPWQLQTSPYTYGFYATFNSPDVSKFAITNGDVGGSGSTTRSKLISPTFSLVGYSAATLTFQHFYQYWNTADIARLEISIDGGSTWTLINNYTATTGAASSFASASFSLAAYLGNANCQIRFNYGSTWGYFWAVDNVLITGTPTAGTAPTWSPTTYLFTDPAFTTPYVAGTPATTVYVHPTTVSSLTTVNYIATSTGTTSCNSYDTGAVTINTGLPAITGPSSVCWGGTISLANPTPSGTWSASNNTVATVSPSGVVTGLSVGIDTIYYNVTGCGAFQVVSVNPGTAITGAGNVCTAGTISLAVAAGAGTWVSGSPAIATVSGTGVVSGVAGGSSIITFTTTATGCKDSAIVTVVTPGVISGAPGVCTGAVAALSETVTGGTWTSTPTAQATVDASTGAVYGVAAGNVTITYTAAPACYTTFPMTVNASPAAITGVASVCATSSTTLADATPSGSWSVSAGSIATVTPGGVTTGLVAGNATVTYTTPNTCFATLPVTVNVLPAPISGITSVCQMAVTTLSSSPSGGTWTSGATTVATVAADGGVYGINGGTTPITYTTTAGCKAYTTVTVNLIPGAITGNNFVCYAGSTTLSNPTPSGSWSSSNPLIASVGTTGVVYGIATGFATISYTTGTNGCYAAKAMTVSPIAPPTVSITSSTGSTVCAGIPVTYVPTIVGGGTAPLYVWSVNNVILSGASSYTYTPANGDMVRLWIISSYACAVPDTGSAAVYMTVNPIVTPAVSLTTGMGDTVCTTSLTTIYPVPTGGGTTPSYQWTVNGVPSGVGPTYTYAPNNGDIINCVMTSNAPCRTVNTATASKTLTVSAPITPMVSISSALGSVTCDGYPDVLNTTMYGGGTAPTYIWSVNGTPAGMGAGYTYVPGNGDVVTVTMTSNFPCLATPTASDNITLTVLPITQPVGEITAQPGYIIPAGMYDTFTCNIISGGGMAPTYQWFINSIPQAGATNSVYITNNLHTGDSVACQVVNTDQCSGVTVFSYMNITVGNNVGVHDISGQGSNVMLVPNPNNGTFRVKGNIAGVISGAVGIQVTDMLGRAIYTGNADVVNGLVDSELQLGSDLANGTYLLTIRNGAASNTLHFTLQR